MVTTENGRTAVTAGGTENAGRQVTVAGRGNGRWWLESR